MHVSINSELIFGIFISMIVICILLFIALIVVKNADKSKPIITKNAKILEKKISQGKIEWYIVEMEDGERLQLRTFNADTLLLSIGDSGTISYRGKTIISFKRK